MACRLRTGFDITGEMGLGWNLGNSMDAVGNTAAAVGDETYWGNPKTTQTNLDTLKSAGFTTLRLPVSWDDHTGPAPTYTLNTAWLNRVEEIVNYALNDGMYVIVNIHHNDGWEDPTIANEMNAKDRLVKLWAQIATRFERYDHHVIFETVNEPRDQKGSAPDDWYGSDASYFSVLNRLNAAALDAIRATGGNNARRLVMMPGYAAAVDAHQLDPIIMPNDKMIALSAHSYSPYNFALNQGGGSVTTFTDTVTIDDIFTRLDTKFIQRGIPVIMGEWGALDKNNLAERVKQASYFGKKGRAYKIPLVWWDNGTVNSTTGENFAILNRNNNTWYFPEIVDAIKTGWQTAP